MLPLRTGTRHPCRIRCCWIPTPSRSARFSVLPIGSSRARNTPIYAQAMSAGQRRIARPFPRAFSQRVLPTKPRRTKPPQRQPPRHIRVRASERPPPYRTSSRNASGAMIEISAHYYPDGSGRGGGGGGAYLTAGLNGAGAHSDMYRPPTPVAPASIPLRSTGVVVAYTLPRRGGKRTEGSRKVACCRARRCIFFG